jgi:hypothetical protein
MGVRDRWSAGGADPSKGAEGAGRPRWMGAQSMGTASIVAGWNLLGYG